MNSFNTPRMMATQSGYIPVWRDVVPRPVWSIHDRELKRRTRKFNRKFRSWRESLKVGNRD